MAKVSPKEVEQLIKSHFKKVNIHLRLLKCLHELALLHKDLDRAYFENAIREHVGEDDFKYLKDFHKIS